MRNPQHRRRTLGSWARPRTAPRVSTGAERFAVGQGWLDPPLGAADATVRFAGIQKAGSLIRTDRGT